MEIKMMNIDYNPLIVSGGCGSIGDCDTYLREQEERNDAIKNDPRYPSWLEELKHSEEQKQREFRLRTINAERLWKKYSKDYSSKVKPNKDMVLFIFLINDSEVMIPAFNLEEARYILVKKGNININDIDTILECLNNKPYAKYPLMHGEIITRDIDDD